MQPVSGWRKQSEQTKISTFYYWQNWIGFTREKTQNNVYGKLNKNPKQIYCKMYFCTYWSAYCSQYPFGRNRVLRQLKYSLQLAD